MPRYPTEICPKCQKNHRKGLESRGEMKNQQTFYYEAHLSNIRVPNQYRWKTYRCTDCNLIVMFITHEQVKNSTQLNKLVNSVTVHLIQLNDNFEFGK